MKKLTFSSDYFSPTQTLECGQIFRFKKASLSGENNNGYVVFSRDKACFLAEENNRTCVYCLPEDEEYFYNYFDESENYGEIFTRAKNCGVDVLAKAAESGKGIRILRQDPEEMLYSFVISQNNNIPRIKKIINGLCEALGEKKTINGFEYRAFPKTQVLAEQTEEFFVSMGLGYRAGYMKNLSEELKNGLLEEASSLSGEKLKARLLKIKGIGEKVADCACLFGFHKTDSFPVDVWLEKVYREDFKGELTDRKKITSYFTQKFGQDSGYFQQYLFYYKRSIEKK